MALNPSTNSTMSGRVTAADADYPYGSSKNESSPGAGDGTPYFKARADDIFGFQQAILSAAGLVPSGDPDTALESQYLDGVRRVVSADTGGFLVFDAVGVTPWTVPDVLKDGVRKAKVTVYGGGGGGAAESTDAGAGGGGGGVSIGSVDLTGVTSVDITVGAGGAGAVAPASGGTGGTSSFGAFMSATGGDGGSSASTGGSGVGTGGDFNSGLGPGGTESGMAGVGGAGGGPGGRGVFNSAGEDAVGPGGGGAGGAGGNPGGNGFKGTVIIEW